MVICENTESETRQCPAYIRCRRTISIAELKYPSRPTVPDLGWFFITGSIAVLAMASQIALSLASSPFAVCFSASTPIARLQKYFFNRSNFHGGFVADDTPIIDIPCGRIAFGSYQVHCPQIQNAQGRPEVTYKPQAAIQEASQCDVRAIFFSRANRISL